MSCNCKADIEARLLERLKTREPDGAHHSVRLSSYGFCIIGDTLQRRPYMDVNQSVDVPKKAGGGFKNIKPKLAMYFSYCPFCGKQVAEGEAEPTK